MNDRLGKNGADSDEDPVTPTTPSQTAQRGTVRDWRDYPPSLETLHMGLATVDKMVADQIGQHRRFADAQSGLSSDVAEIKGVLLRVESVVLTLAAANDVRDREIKREHAWTDRELRKIRSEAAATARRLSADDSQQREALSSQSEVLDLAVAVVKKDVLGKTSKRPPDASIEKWKIVAGVITAVIIAAGGVAAAIYGATRTAPTIQAEPHH